MWNVIQYTSIDVTDLKNIAIEMRVVEGNNMV